MERLNNIFDKVLQNFFFKKPVQCVDYNTEETVGIDSPQFGQMDPHLKVDEEEFEQDGRSPQEQLKYKRRPPPFEGLMNNIKAITKKVEHIRGFKFELAGAVSQNFHTSHSWTIPNSGQLSQSQMTNPQMKQQPQCYGLALQYVGGDEKLLQQGKTSVIMTGRWDSTGRLEAAIIKNLQEDQVLRLQGAYPNDEIQYAQMHLEYDKLGDDYNWSVKYGTGQFGFSFMQTIGDNLILGFDFMSILERKISMLNYAAKYTHKKNHKFFAQYVAPSDQLSLAYSLNVKRGTTLISELNYTPSEGKTQTIVGYRQRFPRTEVIATLNSHGKISTVLNLLGATYQLKICAIADYFKDVYKFGYGISLGQVQ